MHIQCLWSMFILLTIKCAWSKHGIGIFIYVWFVVIYGSMTVSPTSPTDQLSSTIINYHCVNVKVTLSHSKNIMVKDCWWYTINYHELSIIATSVVFWIMHSCQPCFFVLMDCQLFDQSFAINPSHWVLTKTIPAFLVLTKTPTTGMDWMEDQGQRDTRCDHCMYPLVN